MWRADLTCEFELILTYLLIIELKVEEVLVIIKVAMF